MQDRHAYRTSEVDPKHTLLISVISAVSDFHSDCLQRYLGFPILAAAKKRQKTPKNIYVFLRNSKTNEPKDSVFTLITRDTFG